MRIEHVELRELSLPLKYRFETSFAVERNFHKVLLILRGDGMEGYGEGTANKFPGYCYETSDTIWLALANYILPIVLGNEYATPACLLQALEGIRGHQMAIATLETAFWDLQAKAAGLPLWVLLGGSRTAHPVGASLGIQDSVEATVDIAQAHWEQGYKRLKFKIKPGWDVEPLQAVKTALPDASLTVDANSAYRLADTASLLALDELGLDYIEQPLAHDDLHDHARLQKIMRTPICLDESIHTPNDARKALELDAGRIINLKLGRVGGHLQARRVHDTALSFSAPVWCGGMLELGIGRAHNLHMSSLENFTLPGDTASASRYWEQDIVYPWLDAVDGIQHIPPGPGLGVELRQDVIDRFTVRRQTFPG